MAPIYDTDLADERFAKDEWNRYELWEKVEVRLRRRKRLWVGATCLVFLCLSSVPIVMDRLPKWRALAASRRLGQEINRIKREASREHAAFRIRFAGQGSLEYAVERASSCSDQSPRVERRGSLIMGSTASGFALLTPEQGSSLGVQGFSDSICYDYLAGSDAILRDRPLVGFGIAPVNDLAEGRSDRLAILLASGPSAEISFE
jgi:hypothetical protein